MLTQGCEDDSAQIIIAWIELHQL